MDSTLSQESQESNKAIWELSDDETDWKELQEDWDSRRETDTLIAQIERGRQGLNVGMDCGLPNLSRYTYGTHAGTYYLLGAESSVGKSTLTDFMFLYKLWLYCRNNKIKLHVKYFSFELSANQKKARWISLFLYHIYQISIPSAYVIGRVHGNLVTDEDMLKIMKAKAAVNDMMRCIELIDTPMHPTGIFMKVVRDHYEGLGVVERDGIYIKNFKPYDPTEVTVVIVDHMSLVLHEKDLTTTKLVMDRLSNHFLRLRNIFNTTIVAVQQFNTDMTTAQRERKKDQSVIIPQRVDFGDSKYTFRDCDIALGLVSPRKQQVDEYFGYKVDKLRMSFLGLHLMKSRDGADNKMLPLFLNPVAGHFWDLPLTPGNEQSMLSYYKEAQKLEEICRLYSPKSL